MLDEDRKFAEEQAEIMRKFKTDYTEDLVTLTNQLESMINDEHDFTSKELEAAQLRINELH